ncbi:hypothetical protein M404DRAFT_993301 [Pisolithus tinctorius Marx 270]|uniref:Uncharacterized protein n=1 Tax=Pisolithus tinctorius Marx 270 TaxID=870435 RepID=A0A0C3JXA1_PISTI|nr:hypothetical protein M404DRAFT_993301 [Pisolithus tinctorius Marx 270]
MADNLSHRAAAMVPITARSTNMSGIVIPQGKDTHLCDQIMHFWNQGILYGVTHCKL